MKNVFIIYLAGLTGVFKAVSLGVVLQASPAVIALMTVLGSLTAATLLYLLGGWLRNILENRMSEKRLVRKKEKTKKIHSKYGIIGLGILGTLALGLHITLIIGLVIVPSKRKLMLWTAVGIVVWTSVFTAAAAGGKELFTRMPFFG